MGISKKSNRQCKSGGFIAKFCQELKCGILIKIRMVWLLFETSRNLRNLSCLETGKIFIFQYFRGYFKKEL